MGLNYDLVVHRPETEESFGYLCEWGDEGSAPMSIESTPPDVPVSTSSGVTQAGGQFSARDAAPPYPIEINNWQDGAGQETYDKADSSPEAFRSSRNIESSQEGHFELGPRVIHFPDWFMSNKMYAAMGTFWAGFSPEANADSDQPYSLRFLHRYTLTSGSNATDYLADTTDTSFVVTAATNLVDLAIAETLDAPIAEDLVHSTSPGHIMGDYLYCPTHNEVIHVTAVAGTTLTVERGECGTTAAAHTAGETWYGFNWTGVQFAETEPVQALSAVSTDGKYVYAAFHNTGTDNGSVWRGTVTDTTEWTSFDARNNVTALCFCGGYLYGAQDNLSGVTSAGWFNTASSNAYTAISLTGAISQGSTTAGLVGVGNFAYWVVTDSLSRSWVYRIQHSSTDTFELVSELPPGFIATSALSHLGNLYVGGYIDNLATTAADNNLPQYEGALYLIDIGGGVTQAARIRTIYDETAPDSRVKGLCGAGPYIYVLTNEDTYVYDTQHGGWSHYADTTTSSVSGTTESLDWTTAGFDWRKTLTEPDDEDAVYSDYATWDADTDTYVDVGTITTDESSSSGFAKADIGVGMYRFKTDAGKFYRWTIDGLPSSQGTLQVRASDLQSQAGCVVMAGTSKEVRVYLQGVVSGGSVTAHRVGLGYMTDSTGSVSDYSYRWSGTFPVQAHVYRILFSSAGASVYVDDVLALTATYDELRDVTGTEATRIQWAVGWPGDGRSDTYNERIVYHYIKFTSSGAYPPDYAGGTLTTTSMKNIATMQGVTLVPIPGNDSNIGGWDYINTKEITTTGWLETSDSAFHMGSINKYFTSVIAEHSALQTGQTLTVTPIVDDSAAASTSAAALSTTTTATVNSSGRKIRVRVTITDDDPNRLYAERLRVFRITARFFPFNSPHVHTYYLNCREGVQCRTGHDWGYDPEDAIRHLFSAADSGEVVYIESLFTSNVDEGETTEGKQMARIESVKLYQGPGDMQRYDKLTGTVMVKLRKVDE